MRFPAILAYHFLGSSPRGTAKPGLFVSPGEFERQLTTLISDQATFLTFAQLSAGPVPRKSVILTFDDGEESVYTLAYPILRRLGIPASVFVVTSEIGKNGRVWSQSKHTLPLNLIGREAIREMADNGIEFGSHFHHHVRAAGLSDSALQEEFVTSKAVLEDLLGSPVTTVAYPYGSIDSRTATFAESAGYKYGLTIRPGIARNPLRLPRWPVNGRLNFETWRCGFQLAL
jgi:peptidoglycan/xylan/chitin deacetylase (PgdA/CDA1 family)